MLSALPRAGKPHRSWTDAATACPHLAIHWLGTPGPAASPARLLQESTAAVSSWPARRGVVELGGRSAASEQFTLALGFRARHGQCPAACGHGGFSNIVRRHGTITVWLAPNCPWAGDGPDIYKGPLCCPPTETYIVDPAQQSISPRLLCIANIVFILRRPIDLRISSRSSSED